VDTRVKTSTKLITFLALIAVYLLLIDVTGVKFRLFSGRFTGPGIDVYVVGDYVACFYSGPFIGPMDPYPYRSTCAFIGGLLMAAASFWKFVVLR
jgi:hypothetical protein